ncbi:MAG: hypothetical protein JSS34_07780 [Proteobacteria bacterium]|nr:hypothetical protein [Pseudomonadota bacterium]
MKVNYTSRNIQNREKMTITYYMGVFATMAMIFGFQSSQAMNTEDSDSSAAVTKKALSKTNHGFKANVRSKIMEDFTNLAALMTRFSREAGLATGKSFGSGSGISFMEATATDTINESGEGGQLLAHYKILLGAQIFLGDKEVKNKFTLEAQVSQTYGKDTTDEQKDQIWNTNMQGALLEALTQDFKRKFTASLTSN